MNYKIDLNAPRASWLFKLSQNSFGKQKWQPRFFILLDNEIRYYRDEYSDQPSQILHLSNISQVIPLLDRPCTFRLEPTFKNNDTKPWTIECTSQKEMEVWVESIHHRLSLTPVFESNTFITPTPSISSSSIHPFFSSMKIKKSMKNSLSTPIKSNHHSLHLSSSTHSISSLSRRRMIVPTTTTTSTTTSVHPLDLS
ncbi:hypothetical protein BJ944DRAFT_246017 [Cunninghamella echinulata]|nr:hypothetical protein BJ944DRAFT_246017 [Cunninghamella echinulata]